MTTPQYERGIPPLTLGWRLKMALAHGDMSREKMAENLGLSPSTLSRWMGDQGEPPKRAFLLQWALLTGTDESWLLTGKGSPPPPHPDGGLKHGQPAATGAALARLTAAKTRRTQANRRYATAA